MRFTLILIATLFLSPQLWAEKQDLAKLNPLTARGFFKTETLRQGELADFQLELNLQEGFFAYQERFRLKVKSPEQAQVG